MHDSASGLDGVVARVTRRLIPFLLLMYVLAFLDRANIGFAKQAFQADTGLSNAAYAMGAGIFFAGYALFEVPSNLILHRVGARLWLGRIMVTWGLISAAMAWASTERSFYTLRFLLGAAEAGFFPGVIYYLTQWYPASHRASALGLFYFGAPLAFTLGGPLSGWLLELDGKAGWHGWQWMFVVEGVLASLTGLWALVYLDNKPSEARWLETSQRAILQTALEREAEAIRTENPGRVWKALRDPRVLYLCAIYLLVQVGVYGITFYLPTQVAALLGRKVGLVVSLVTAIPWLCAMGAVYWIPRRFRSADERRLASIAVMALAGIGIATAGSTSNPAMGLAALCVSAACLIAVQPLFWTLPTAFLTGAAAAGGIALINSLGNLGGFIAPNLRNWAEQHWGGGPAGSWALAVAAWASAMLFARTSRWRK